MMDLGDYIRLFRRRFWAIVLVAVLFGALGYLKTTRDPLVYQAETMIAVGGYIQSPNPDSASIVAGRELAQSYIVLATTYDVLLGAINVLGLADTPETLRQHISVSAIPNTSLLRIQVSYGDPEMCAALANQIAVELIRQSPGNLTPEQQKKLEMAQAAIDTLDQDLRDLRQQLEDLDEQLLAKGSTLQGEEWQRLMTQRNWLVERISEATTSQAQFFVIVRELEQQSNVLRVVEEARAPANPSNTGPLLLVVAGVIVGGGLAAGLVVLREYFDETIRGPEEVVEEVGLAVLTLIPRFGRRRDRYPRRLITRLKPHDPVSERYRALRARLLLTSDGRDKKVFVVTSSGPHEGKSVTVSNLAVAMAAAGRRVVLVDADLRQPSLHRIFELDNEVGLSTLLSGAVEGRLEPTLVRQCLQDSAIPNLCVVTSGPIPDNPAELLGSDAMREWVQGLQKHWEADVLLFDAPPALVVSDTSVLAATINASVVMVLRAGHASFRTALEAKRQLLQLGIALEGVVLNFVRKGDLGAHRAAYDHHYRPTSKSRAQRQPKNGGNPRSQGGLGTRHAEPKPAAAVAPEPDAPPAEPVAAQNGGQTVENIPAGPVATQNGGQTAENVDGQHGQSAPDVSRTDNGVKPGSAVAPKRRSSRKRTASDNSGTN